MSALTTTVARFWGRSVVTLSAAFLMAGMCRKPLCVCGLVSYQHWPHYGVCVPPASAFGPTPRIRPCADGWGTRRAYGGWRARATHGKRLECMSVQMTTVLADWATLAESGSTAD